MLHAVPALMRQVVERVRETRGALPAVRRAFVGGDAVPPDLLGAMRDVFPGAEVRVLYGPTEGTIICAAHRVRGGEAGGRHLLGRPLDGAPLYVLDAAGEPAPVGVPGELCIGGAGVARGYLGRAELTADRFVPDPFGAVPGARMYRTGDRARWGADGVLEFLGRLDAQVKVRGFRIEPGEIEARLAAHPGVREAVVLVREDAPGEKRLAAYVVPSAEGVEAAELREHLRARLPEHMVPSAVVLLGELPLTRNGKVDRGALPAPEGAGAAAEWVAPRTPTEEVMAGIWGEVLGLERVGAADNFFELGGHSLLATQVASRVRAACGVELPVRALFETSTLAELAERVDAAVQAGTAERELQAELDRVAALSDKEAARLREPSAGEPADGSPHPLPPAGARAASTPDRLASLSPERLAALRKLLLDRSGARADARAIRPREGGGPAPLSFAQQRLWIIDRMEPGGSAYNMPLALRLRGLLDPGVLGRALAEVVRRHESLRTTFGDDGGAPFQVVHPAGRSPLGSVDLSRLPAAGREAEAGRLVVEHAARPFDLAAGPLFRPTLLRLADAEHVLLLAMHHIVSDGWSMGVMFRELAALYEAFGRGEPSPLPELPVQYPDFAAWQRAWLSGETLERELAWWRERLAGAPAALELPTDRPRPPLPGARAGGAARVLPRAAAERVRALARREGATTFMVLLAALDLLLARWSGEDDVVVGAPIANRNLRETEGLIGFFVNTLALRADVGGNPAFRGLLARVRETTLGAYQHQDVPFERLVETLGVERTTSHTPLFQVMFSTDDGGGGPPAFGGLETGHFRTGTPAAKFDLTVSVGESEAGMVVRFGYRDELWEAATMERVIDAYGLLLEGAAADPARAVLDLPLLADSERERVLREWSPGPAAPRPSLAVHEMVSGQAARTPDAAAVSFGDRSLTYAELEARSDALAAGLRRLGVAPGERVAICLERSPEWVVAVLAVMKSGAAYVPMDPANPDARLARLLSDAGARVLVTQASLRDRLAADGVEVVLVDEDPSALPHSRTPALSHSSSPDDLAYVVYTSGSTGTPKGVLVEHGSLAATLLAVREAFGFAPGGTFPVLASPAFDIWAFEALLPLTLGGTARILPREDVQDVARLAAEVERADALHAVPALMREVARAAREGAADFARLRRVFVGGDAVPPELVEEMREAFPAAEIRVMYGPTEGTIICASVAVAAEGGVERRMIGAPLPGVSLYVCDARGGVVPPGLPGELWIGGAGVARGYLGRAELTAERFVPDPFAGGARGGARLYRTGDRARWLEVEDGTLEFLGRTDRQVKVRGFRIEPGEIEAVLERHPGVRGAAVVVREDQPGDRRIVAYLEADASLPVAEVRELARASLPEYMVPAAVVVMETLPLTPTTGKLDRRALPAPEAPEAPGDQEPRTELERAIAAVWAEVLGLPSVGTGTSFFDLGGNSLLVVQVVARLEAALGYKVSALDVFQHTSVAALARHLGGAAEAEAAPDAGRDRSGKLAAGKGRLDRLRKRRDGDG